MAKVSNVLSSVVAGDYIEIHKLGRGQPWKAALSALATYMSTAMSSITGNVTGNVTGNLTGGVIAPTSTDYTGADAPTLAISPAVYHAKMTKSGAPGAYTLAAPGAGNVGHFLLVENGAAQAHTITATSLAGGNTLTFTNVVGACVLLYAVSATVWSPLALGGATLSTA